MDINEHEVLINDLFLDATLVIQAYLNSLEGIEKNAAAAAIEMGCEAEVRCRLRPGASPGLSLWLFPRDKDKDGMKLVSLNLD